VRCAEAAERVAKRYDHYDGLAVTLVAYFKQSVNEQGNRVTRIITVLSSSSIQCFE